MRKWVIGVVAVVVLHIGFNSYMARDRASLVEERVKNSEAIKAIYPVVEGGPSVVDVAALWPEPIQAVELPVTRPVRVRELAPQPALASYRIKRMPEQPIERARKTQRVPEPPKPFKEVVIAVRSDPRNRTEYPNNPPANTIAIYSDAKSKRKSEDPLFFTVFKKPAGWLRSVASKVF